MLWRSAAVKFRGREVKQAYVCIIALKEEAMNYAHIDLLRCA